MDDLIYVKVPLTASARIHTVTYPFTTFALRAEDIGVVFPLIHAIGTEIDLSRWDSFARRIIDAPEAAACGIIGLRSAAGYVSGVEHDLRHGSVCLQRWIFSTKNERAAP